MAQQAVPYAVDAGILDRFARFYDDDYRDFDADVGAILALAEEAAGPILELGCGTGRILLPLADAGYDVSGVDASAALLAVARKKLVAAGLASRVRLTECDLQALHLPADRFALAVCTSNTLMHVADPLGQEAVLTEAFRVLRPGGTLFVDLFNPDVARLIEVDGVQELADRWEDMTTGADVLKWSVRTLDMAEQLQETLFVYEEILPDGQTRRTACPFTLRYLWRHEGELMLRQAGFDEIEVWGSFEADPYDALSERLIFVAHKPEGATS